MGKNWYVTGDGNWDVEAVERMKHVRVFCIGLMINELTTLIAACVGLYVRKIKKKNVDAHSLSCNWVNLETCQKMYFFVLISWSYEKKIQRSHQYTHLRSYYQNMNDENPSFFFEDLITSMELTITASILALIVYGRLLWIDFDSDKYTGVHALIKWATLFVVRCCV